MSTPLENSLSISHNVSKSCVILRQVNYGKNSFMLLIPGHLHWKTLLTALGQPNRAPNLDIYSLIPCPVSLLRDAGQTLCRLEHLLRVARIDPLHRKNSKRRHLHLHGIQGPIRTDSSLL